MKKVFQREKLKKSKNYSLEQFKSRMSVEHCLSDILLIIFDMDHQYYPMMTSKKMKNKNENYPKRFAFNRTTLVSQNNIGQLQTKRNCLTVMPALMALILSLIIQDLIMSYSFVSTYSTFGVMAASIPIIDNKINLDEQLKNQNPANVDSNKNVSNKNVVDIENTLNIPNFSQESMLTHYDVNVNDNVRQQNRLMGPKKIFRLKRSGIADQRLAELIELVRLNMMQKMVRNSYHRGETDTEEIAFGLIDPAIIGRRRRRKRSIKNDIVSGPKRGTRSKFGNSNNRNRNKVDKISILKLFELLLQSEMNSNDQSYHHHRQAHKKHQFPLNYQNDFGRFGENE